MIDRKSRLRRNIFDISILIVTITIFIFLLFPFGWIFYSSFIPSQTVFTKIKASLTFENYKNIFKAGFSQFIVNSLFYSITSVIITTFISILAAYVFSRKKFFGKRFLFGSVVSGQMFPWVVLVTPLYILFSRMRLINSYLGIICTYIAVSIPFSVYLLTGYIRTVPYNLDDAALIDGCSHFRLVWQIIFPVILPGVVATATYNFILAWNDYLFALAFLSKTSMKTIPLGLTQFFGEYSVDWGSVMAASAIAVIPTLIIFLVIQNRMVSGLTAGSIKQ